MLFFVVHFINSKFVTWCFTRFCFSSKRLYSLLPIFTPWTNNGLDFSRNFTLFLVLCFVFCRSFQNASTERATKVFRNRFYIFKIFFIITTSLSEFYFQYQIKKKPRKSFVIDFIHATLARSFCKICNLVRIWFVFFLFLVVFVDCSFW